MPAITLPIKVHNHHQLNLAENYLRNMVKGLKVDIEISKKPRGWLQLSASGPDQKVAIRYLSEEIGQCPKSWEKVEKFATFKGYISSLEKTELQIDIGISSPDMVIPLSRLQAQLADGRETSLKKIAELFGLCVNLPLTVKVSNMQEDPRFMEGSLPEKQLTLYRKWTKSLLDRLIILGASLNEVKRAVRGSRRDIIDVESFSFLEHSMVCKLGTEAVGLIPRIGRQLRKARLEVFNSKRVLKFLGDYQVL